MIRLLLPLFILLFGTCIALPPTEPQRIDHVLQEYFPTLFLQEIKVTPFKGGYSTAKNYRIDVPGQTFALRLQDLNYSKENLTREIFGMQSAAEAGIAPEIYWVSADKSAILMEYIKCPTLTMQEAQKPENIAKMAEALRILHTLPKNPVETADFITSLKALYKTMKKNKHNTPAADRAMKDAIEVQKVLDQQHYPHATTHGDLHGRNIFFTPDGVKFIDWSETNYSDPLYDVACYAMLLGFSIEQELKLLENYYQAPASDEQLTHYAMIKRILLTTFSFNMIEFSYYLSEEQGIEINKTRRLQTFAWYLNKFNESDSVSAQVFYDWAMCILQEL